MEAGHFSPEKVTCRSKRGHFEEAGICIYCVWMTQKLILYILYVSTCRTQMSLYSLLIIHPHITTWLPPILKSFKVLTAHMCLEPHQENIPARQQSASSPNFSPGARWFSSNWNRLKVIFSVNGAISVSLRPGWSCTNVTSHVIMSGIRFLVSIILKETFCNNYYLCIQYY